MDRRDVLKAALGAGVGLVIGGEAKAAIPVVDEVGTNPPELVLVTIAIKVGPQDAEPFWLEPHLSPEQREEKKKELRYEGWHFGLYPEYTMWQLNRDRPSLPPDLDLTSVLMDRVDGLFADLKAGKVPDVDPAFVPSGDQRGTISYDFATNDASEIYSYEVQVEELLRGRGRLVQEGLDKAMQIREKRVGYEELWRLPPLEMVTLFIPGTVPPAPQRSL